MNDWPIASGLLPTRGSLMLDVIFTATFAIVLVMAWSIYLVRVRRNFRLHARVQLALGIALLLAITAFEIELQWLTDWRELAEPSPYWSSGWVQRALRVHLCFAIPTPFVWVATTLLALRWFGWSLIAGRDPTGIANGSFVAPGDRSTASFRWSSAHRFLGWTSAVLMLLTTATGWWFYYVAFIAS